MYTEDVPKINQGGFVHRREQKQVIHFANAVHPQRWYQQTLVRHNVLQKTV